MRTARLLSLLSMSALLISACASPAQAARPDGRAFISTGVTVDGVDRPLVDGTQIRLDFARDGNLGATAGCNQIGGSWRIDDGVLRVDATSMTEMGCDAARHDQDEWLVDFLASGPRLSLDGSDLTLVSGSTTVRLVDRAVAAPDAQLVGTRWVVTGLRTGDAVSTVPDGLRASLTLADDGSLVFENGCNEGGGQYRLEGTSIDFPELIQTEKACLDDAGTLERAVMAVLGAPELRWSIEEDRLTLDAGGTGMDLTAEPAG